MKAVVLLVALAAVLAQVNAACVWSADTSAECNCFTDLSRSPFPVRLINTGASTSTNNFESGILGDDLVLGFELDGKYFVSTSNPSSGNVDLYTNAGSVVRSVPASQMPVVEFRNLNDNSVLCSFGYRDGLLDTEAQQKGHYDVTLGTNFPSITLSECGQSADDTSAEPLATTNKVKVTYDFTDALSQCGFTTDADANEGANTIYTARVVVRTTEWTTPIRGTPLTTVVEAPFTVNISFPNTVEVTSSEVTVIGEVVSSAAITHQIWDTTHRWLDLNLFSSASYPYRFLHDSSGGWTSYTNGGYAELSAEPSNTELNSEPWHNIISLDAAGTDDVRTDSISFDTAIDYTARTLIDYEEDGLTIDDPYKWGVSSNFVIDESDSDDFYPTQTLPETTCGTLQTDNCLQNTHIRLQPRAGWCDVTFGYTLRLRVGCRDSVDGCAQPSDIDESNRFAEFTFTTASDNFCPRIVATTGLNGVVGIYDSTNWGSASLPGRPDESLTEQNQFVFGQKLYVQTVVGADANINIATITTEQIWVSTSNFNAPEDITGLGEEFVNEDSSNWAQLVYDSAGSEPCGTTSTDASFDMSGLGCTVGSPSIAQQAARFCSSFNDEAADTPCQVVVSDRIAPTAASGQTAGVDFDSLVGGGAHITSTDNAADTDDIVGRSGKHFEGVARAIIRADKYTIKLGENVEAAAPAVIWVFVSVTYKAAADQESVRRYVVRHDVSNGKSVSTLVDGGATNGRVTVGIRGSSSAGASSSSTLFGLSSTTVLGVAVAIGGVIAFAAIALVVSRRRAGAAQPVKSSSSVELNAATPVADATDQA